MGGPGPPCVSTWAMCQLKLPPSSLSSLRRACSWVARRQQLLVERYWPLLAECARQKLEEQAGTWRHSAGRIVFDGSPNQQIRRCDTICPVLWRGLCYMGSLWQAVYSMVAGRNALSCTLIM